MLRLIIIVGLAFFVYKLVSGLLGLTSIVRQSQKMKRRLKERQGGEMAEDPNCHTYVPKSTAIQKNISGQIYYFCGSDCAETFLKNK